ncbi:hypothetical protein BJP41_07755 [Candidatus Williamhamiltonella defendens]|uniref:DUF3018 domain-containing protein n=2 Tax=Candidatus Williamhamiltonella defendens TaxID=138072 RepID=A0A2D3T8W4_9ENTR|nr:antitoxin MazE family protein [Candidatus Hamiltonella defensa]ACQ67021.1 hypothetical protein HDEF_0255 [Candidatus Hamiltonella defensa 5AT (Acyrthosiphon pisum)]ASV32960.1 DUF3018 domain-containing protein [Candidatus Hamiltonella defensa]ATW21804.1 hypothetical protein BJP44_01170 [Candidatus Hamiltonella defensa]ATW30228.1 hypothetical protein BJP41_07755 [Candidatus Hamiltonella defensa]ATW32239.1 hypothetical protein BJP42_08050 [Candidatus Hamiltonella defensa]
MTVNQRVRKHREALRQAGYRPVTIWVPDTRDLQFIEKCRNQSVSLNQRDETKIMDWIDEVSDTEGWE